MSEEIARRAFEYFGALAFVIIGLMAALTWVVRQWMTERTKNDTLQQARLDDAKTQLAEAAKTGEAMRVTMADNTNATEANTKVLEAIVSQDRGGRR